MVLSIRKTAPTLVFWQPQCRERPRHRSSRSVRTPEPDGFVEQLERQLIDSGATEHLFEEPPGRRACLIELVGPGVWLLRSAGSSVSFAMRLTFSYGDNEVSTALREEIVEKLLCLIILVFAPMNTGMEFDHIRFHCKKCDLYGVINAIYVSLTVIVLEGQCPACLRRSTTEFDLLRIDRWLRDEVRTPVDTMQSPSEPRSARARGSVQGIGLRVWSGDRNTSRGPAPAS